MLKLGNKLATNYQSFLPLAHFSSWKRFVLPYHDALTSQLPPQSREHTDELLTQLVLFGVL